MHQCQRFLICPLDLDIYPVTFPLFRAGPLWGFNWVNVSFEILHLTFSRDILQEQNLYEDQYVPPISSDGFT